jgi:hypothetical protein
MKRKTVARRWKEKKMKYVTKVIYLPQADDITSF